jgi:hypothetical protein
MLVLELGLSTILLAAGAVFLKRIVRASLARFAHNRRRGARKLGPGIAGREGRSEDDCMRLLLDHIDKQESAPVASTSRGSADRYAWPSPPIFFAVVLHAALREDPYCGSKPHNTKIQHDLTVVQLNLFVCPLRFFARPWEGTQRACTETGLTPESIPRAPSPNGMH